MKRMKIQSRGQTREPGVAIVMVLAILMLMTVMIVSFFSMATNELRASRATADGLRALTAKDIAINLAVAQIRDATTRENTSWISQPGAIRLFGNKDRTGRARSIYKLYSSNTMTASRVEELANDIPKDWNEKVARYVDLNPPAIVPDPSNPKSLAQSILHFPIVDPRAFISQGAPGSVEGFSYDGAAVNGFGNSEISHLKRLPMPVQWLYVLADGSIGYLDSNDRFVGRYLPTEENPIVSRLAFWTDDESCKVNVNTASEGVYWDTPRVDTTEDRGFARKPPLTGEYQRYPGHPAMTSLSPVLFPNEGKGKGGRLDPEEDLDKFETLWKIAPGISTGAKEETGTAMIAPVQEALTPDPARYHLYTSSDEVLFSGSVMGAKRETQSPNLATRLQRGRFFLTARSRAPEITVGSHPRMLMWPVAVQRSERTPFDRVMAFCGTIGGGAYYFQRRSAYSRHNEFYTRVDGRNRILYDYFRSATDETILGYGGSFREKYGPGLFDDRDNILAESFDYIRGTNLYDGNNEWSYTKGGESDLEIGHGQIAGICLCGGTRLHRERWANSRLPLPKGFGRMFGLSEISLFAILRAERMTEGRARGSEEDVRRLRPGQKMVQMGLLLETFAPAQGWTSLQPQLTASFGGGYGNANDRPPTELKLNEQTLGWDVGRGRHAARRFVQVSEDRPKDWIAWGGAGGVRVFENVLSFRPVILDQDQVRLKFSGTTAEDPLRVILYDTLTDEFDVNNLVQSYQLEFPEATFPLPRWWSPHESDEEYNSLASRMEIAIEEGVEKLFSAEHDVIQSLVSTHGDYRIITSKRVVTADSFVPHPNYGDSRMAHSLTDFTSSRKGAHPLPGAQFFGTFLAGVNYRTHRRPDFPIGPTRPEWASDAQNQNLQKRGYHTPATTGDFDTGVGSAPDGPYINRPDDGDVRGIAHEGDSYFEAVREEREEAQALFSPNRLIPSPGMLGSLSTGVQSNIPWQTLLFRPAEADRHYGAKSPPDHLWMDYFWMPVVQPYAISEPFSTAGKLNLNYQILPFTYIRRATPMHALMKAEKMLILPTGAGQTYKDNAGDQKWRHFIDVDETLKQWDAKFAKGEVFRSASEVCEMYLIPEGKKWRGRNDIQNFWNDHRLTGDNVKERPYTNLYPRLTVRSNTFTVHICAQSLTKVSSTPADTWVPGRDVVAGEYRGSAVIERYIDPVDPDIPDYATALQEGEEQPKLDQFYTYRILNEKRFTP